MVLYGGVSLAIYMHGTTKELNRLVKASALVEAGADAASRTPSEQVYSDLIAWLAERDLTGDPGELLLRRIVEADGRSRALISGQPATVALLREVG